ncbi:UDP-N-acetylmuramate dehydrogenase [Chitinispirillales bacterium ANBcel5]|uniref:UDP-N-acetylmuramate dehydrogenase n=1 Tax=Cellulosispirillum alkaliphilum TaxID=3039283 RepID=UPI002A4E4C09|nr:UDP-N-acetylmuramate dehydrogenase [Chitinispirillales bacterium ANBcel5]
MTQLRENIDLAPFTTLRIGGVARYYCEPDSIEQLKEMVFQAKSDNMPILVLGRGSNLLISDSGWSGLVLNLSVKFKEKNWNGNELQCNAGCSLDEIIAEAVSRGLSGLEYLSGIPGTIGGGLTMNAGAFESTVSDPLLSASYLDCSTGEIVEQDKSELEFDYRSSLIKKLDAIVLNSRFRFRPAESLEELGVLRRNVLKRRAAKQPLQYPNCGSVFKRPQGFYAGTLIEKTSLKGAKCGDIEISAKHANFFLNKGKGKAGDVMKLINQVRKAVYELHGVLLEPEVVLAGEFEEPLYTPSL